ncbi:MAG: GGDEF domain-containing protein [Planctomycetota bacterium]
MKQRARNADPRLLVVADLERLAPIVRACFAPNPIFGVRSYLAGIAEIPRAPTRGVLVGHDPACRKPEAAMAALRAVAGEIPIVLCCEPQYEHIARGLLSHGANDYVIFPPEPVELERVLGFPSHATQQSWIETPTVAPTPSAEELARLTDVLPRLVAEDSGVLDAMAALVCIAVRAESATVVLDGRAGHAGRGNAVAGSPALIEPILRNEQRVGQIRVGKSLERGFTHEDTAKLRHYGVLLGRLLEGAERAAEWRRLAFTDELTGLANRRRVLAVLNDTLSLAKKAGSTVSVLYFDIDDFKQYNDAYGHDAGDEILRDIGRLFTQCTRDTDIVARYGGDEFVVVFWDPTGPREVGSHHPKRVAQVLERFRQALSQHTFPMLGPAATGQLTISGGIAHFPRDAHDATELIEAADRALFRAKDAGKNRFWVIGSNESGL